MFLHGDGRSNMIFGNSLIEVGSKIYSEFKRTYKPRKCIINPPYEKNLPIQFVYKALELFGAKWETNNRYAEYNIE
mgnify:CR=1 FL=1